MKAVLDTNVLVAAFLTEGLCAKVLLRARKRDFELALSRDILKETEKVLRKKFRLLPSEIAGVLSLIQEAASELFDKVNPIDPKCRDSGDDKILACARQAEADYIVTGDEDLLILKRYANTAILTPRQFEALFSD